MVMPTAFEWRFRKSILYVGLYSDSDYRCQFIKKMINLNQIFKIKYSSFQLRIKEIEKWRNMERKFIKDIRMSNHINDEIFVSFL